MVMTISTERHLPGRWPGMGACTIRKPANVAAIGLIGRLGVHDDDDLEIRPAYRPKSGGEVGKGLFAPNDNISREQIATIFYRCLCICQGCAYLHL